MRPVVLASNMESWNQVTQAQVDVRPEQFEATSEPFFSQFERNAVEDYEQ